MREYLNIRYEYKQRWKMLYVFLCMTIISGCMVNISDETQLIKKPVELVRDSVYFPNENGWDHLMAATVIPDGILSCGLKTSQNQDTIFKGLLLKTTFDLSLQWFKTYPDGGGQGKFQNMIKTKDNCVILCGNFYESPTEPDKAWLMKTNYNGEKLWSKYYSYSDARDTASYFSSIAVCMNEDYIACGAVYPEFPKSKNSFALAVRTNNSGDTVWTRFYCKVDSMSSDFNSVVAIENGDFVFGGTSSINQNFAKGILICTDPEGQEKWRSEFENFQILQIYKNSTSGFVLVGRDVTEGATLIMTNDEGVLTVKRRYNEDGNKNSICYTLCETADGYILGAVGRTTNYKDAYIIKTNRFGEPKYTKVLHNRILTSIIPLKETEYLGVGASTRENSNMMNLWQAVFTTPEIIM